MTEANGNKKRSSLRQKADKIKKYRCKNLIVVLEDPTNLANIGSVIRNINAFGVEKLYIVDPRNELPKDWHEMREETKLLKLSASAIKWSFVKVFKTTEDCAAYLKRKEFVSVVTSPHIKGKTNVELSQGNFTQKKLAIWFGNEFKGISELAIDKSDACINIEMFGIIESFNLATSTGIVLYEVTKQRREYQSMHSRSIKTNPPFDKKGTKPRII